jgi:lipopolysaccharide cholinephosphotransferase
MENSTLKKLQQKILDLMSILHDVCKKHKLSYYMIGGTMLGAVRHSGFIPWDDDADIGMPREDYQKLVALPAKEWPGYIHMKTPYDSTKGILSYSKLINKNTTLVESYSDYVGGVFLDIFPLDGAGNNLLAAKIHFFSLFLRRILLSYNQALTPENRISRRILRFYAKKKNVRNLFLKMENNALKKSFNESLYIGNIGGAWGFREFMPKSYLGSPRLYQFENELFWGVENPEAYLTSVYGDYMKMPPVECRASHHSFKYLDLSTPFAQYCEKNLGQN